MRSLLHLIRTIIAVFLDALTCLLLLLPGTVGGQCGFVAGGTIAAHGHRAHGTSADRPGANSIAHRVYDQGSQRYSPRQFRAAAGPISQNSGIGDGHPAVGSYTTHVFRNRYDVACQLRYTIEWLSQQRTFPEEQKKPHYENSAPQCIVRASR